jgi:hypothetical protein
MDSADSALAAADRVSAGVGVVAHRRETLGGWASCAGGCGSTG